MGLPSVVEEASIELDTAMREAGLRKAELARRLGIHKQQVERLFDLDHASRIEQLDAAAASLGKRLLIALDRAA